MTSEYIADLVVRLKNTDLMDDFARLDAAYLIERLYAPRMTDEQIKHMVDRFLTWKLPEHFNPDAGISFKPIFNGSQKHEPVGTNLFDATQADAMVRHMIQGMPR